MELSPERRKRNGVGFLQRGDAYGNRTHVTAVKGRCLNLLTNAPYRHTRRIRRSKGVPRETPQASPEDW